MSFKNWMLLLLVVLAGGYLIKTRAMPKSTVEIGEKAYIYGYPLVLMNQTKDVMTNTEEATQEAAPINQFVNKKTFPDPSFKNVVSPNADTLYSSAWLDLTKEPIILSVPEMGDRYYLMEMLDAWTNVFADPGTRTTGNGKGSFAITGPDWNGHLPQGVKEIKAPTNLVWILGRTETNGPEDYAAVHKIQSEYKLVPLSSWGLNDYVAPKGTFNEAIDSHVRPEEYVNQMSAESFFDRLNQLLQTTAIPSGDEAILHELAEIGIGPGRTFAYKNLSEEQKKDLSAAIQKARKVIKDEWTSQKLSTNIRNWSVVSKGIGKYGTNYLTRATVAFGGLGANLPEDAIYPYTQVDSEGRPLSGEYKYVIHMDKDELPPVGAFWSFTAYDDQQFFIENPIDRYAIGDKSHLKYNEDGSVDIYIQHESPGPDKESNWLPVGNDGFNLIMRLYWPDQEILDGTWKPPYVKRV